MGSVEFSGSGGNSSQDRESGWGLGLFGARAPAGCGAEPHEETLSDLNLPSSLATAIVHDTMKSEYKSNSSTCLLLQTVITFSYPSLQILVESDQIKTA
mmetsp:Transcript_31663/g.78898  ORF Transcript_31663/g.78898 Transcript_31663/m.78898 type:complete len:99 (+) Transcript_31663:218-514(+)